MKVEQPVLVCDTIDCGNFILVPNVSIKEFNAIKKNIGWTRVAKENKDYCTKCSNPDIHI